MSCWRTANAAKEIAEERERREREVAEERTRQRKAEMRRQMEEKFHEQSSTAALVRERRSAAKSIKVTRLKEEDDIESYLTTFERIMAAKCAETDGHFTWPPTSPERHSRPTLPSHLKT